MPLQQPLVLELYVLFQCVLHRVSAHDKIQVFVREVRLGPCIDRCICSSLLIIGLFACNSVVGSASLDVYA